VSLNEERKVSMQVFPHYQEFSKTYEQIGTRLMIIIYQPFDAICLSLRLTPWSRVLLKKLISATQEIPRIEWNPESSLPRYNRPPPVPVLSQIQSMPPPSHFLKLHLNIILPSTPGSSMWPLSLRFPYQNPVHTSSVPPYVLHAPPI